MRASTSFSDEKMLEIMTEVLGAFGRALKVCIIAHSLSSIIAFEAFSAGFESS